MYIDDVIERDPERRSCHGQSRMLKDVVRVDVKEELFEVMDDREKHIMRDLCLTNKLLKNIAPDEYVDIPVDVKGFMEALVYPDSRMIYNNMVLNFEKSMWIWVSKIGGIDGKSHYAAAWFMKEQCLSEWEFLITDGAAEVPVDTIALHGHAPEVSSRRWREYPIEESWAYSEYEVGPDGKKINPGSETSSVRDAMDADGALQFDASIAYTATIMKVMSIINCKNVELEEEEPDAKLQKARKKNGKLPLLSRHRVMIIPSAAQRKKGHAPQELWKNRAHTVRGHFKTFTEDAPLLGKITGTFWWSPFARGSVAEGVIEKEYELEVAQVG